MDLEKIYRIARRVAWEVCESRAPSWVEDVTQELVLEYYTKGVYINRDRALGALRKIDGYQLHNTRRYESRQSSPRINQIIDRRDHVAAAEARLMLEPILRSTSLTAAQRKASEAFLEGRPPRASGMAQIGQRWTAALRKFRRTLRRLDNRVSK